MLRLQGAIDRVLPGAGGHHDHRVSGQFSLHPGKHTVAGHGPLPDAGDAAVQNNIHPHLGQTFVDRMVFERIVRPVRHALGGGDQRYGTAIVHQQLSQNAAHVVMVIVPQHHVARRQTARHQVIGRVDRHGRVH